MENSRTIITAHLAAFMTILIWGTTFISTKLLLVDFTPFEILFFRFIMGYFALLLVYPRSFKSKGIHEELLFMIAGLCGVTLYFLLENIALTYTFASNVGIIVSIAPFFTGILAHLFLEEEHLHPQFFVGFVLALLGILMIGWNGTSILKLNPIGDILAVLAAMVWAAYSILMKKISKLGYHTISCTRRIFLYGIIFMIPTLFITDFSLSTERFANSSNLLNFLYLGLGASALCFVTWNWCVGILGAVRTSSYIYLVPVITIVASFLILRENITGVALIGACLTLAGLFLSERKEKRSINEIESMIDIKGDS